MSLNVDFDKLDRKKFNSKEFVFVTEDGKTAECFEEIGKDFWIDYVCIRKSTKPSKLMGKNMLHSSEFETMDDKLNHWWCNFCKRLHMPDDLQTKIQQTKIAVTKI